MAKILDEWLPGRNLHPWDEWFDGKPRELIAGEDFTAKPRSMYVMIWDAAKTRGIKVRISQHGNNLQVQAIRD